MLKNMWKDSWVPVNIGTSVPRNEMTALKRALDMCGDLQDEHERELMTEAVLKISIESYKSAKKRQQDKRSDTKRKLIGARLPRYIVEEYERTARNTGRSIYSFVSCALENEYRRCREKEKSGATAILS